jgi:hypothetical protein
MSAEKESGNALQNAILTKSEDGDSSQETLPQIQINEKSKYKDNTNLSKYFQIIYYQLYMEKHLIVGLL